MRVTTRLYFAAFPSVVGVLAVAALAYWGQYARTVPEAILVVAVITAIFTMVLSWVNVRYVAGRVERLARAGGRGSPSMQPRSVHRLDRHSSTEDELDRIEGEVARLETALSLADEKFAQEVLAHAQRRREDAEVFAGVAQNTARQLDDVRLPLHILLENHFGDLNENQEELLGSARSATEIVATDIAALADLARLELGQVSLRRDRVFPADVLHAILPVLRAEAQARGVQLAVDVAPLIPAFHLDAARIQQSLQLILSQYLRAATAGSTMNLSLASGPREVVLEFGPIANVPPSAQMLLSERIVKASLAELSVRESQLTIRFTA